MAKDNKALVQTNNFRKGLIIFFILLAIIVACGVYLYHQSSQLINQHDLVTQSFETN